MKDEESKLLWEAYLNEGTSEFVGSITPEESVYKIMLTKDGSIVIVSNYSGQLVGNVYSYPDGQLIRKIKIDPAEIGE